MKKNLIVLALASFISPLQAMSYDFADDSSSEDDYLMEIEPAKDQFFDFNHPEALLDVWKMGGAQAWKLSKKRNSNDFRMRSGTLAVGEASSIAISVMGQGGSVSFDLTLLGPTGNTVQFFINDAEQLKMVKTPFSKTYSFALPEGEVAQLKWVYTKTTHSDQSRDLARLDNVRIAGNEDTDDDQLYDAWEYKYFDDLSQIASEDFDSDNLNNHKEMAIGTNPASNDSDGDSHEDGWEVARQFDPLSDDANAIAAYSKHIGISHFDAGMAYLEAKNIDQALVHIQKAALGSNYKPAFYQLAEMHYNGVGVPISVQQALVYFEKAAKVGHLDSQLKLGVIYQHGYGVDQNIEAAFAWFRMAAEQDSAVAKRHLMELHQSAD